MRTLLALALTLIASTAAAIDSLGPLPLVPAPYAQTPLDLAANGDDYLAVWSDSRSTLDLEWLEPAHGLFDARLNVVGTPATPVGNRLSKLAYNAKIAPRGAGYLMAYSDPAGLFSVPLDADGAEIGTPKLLGTAATAGPLALASTGTNFLLLQEHAVSMLTADGSIVRSTPIADFIDHSPIWILPNGSYQFVVFRFYCNGVTACLATAVLTTVTSAGDVAEQKLFDLPQGSHVAAAYGNGRVLIANQSTSALSYVEYRLFDAAGHLLHDAVQIAAQPATCCRVSMPAVGWDGHEFLIIYPWPELRFVRVASDGVLLDLVPVVLDPAGGTPPLFASSGATMTIVWGSGDYLGFDLVSRTVRTFDELAVAATRDVTKSFPLERGVQLADGPAGALAVWREGYPNPSILASIVNRTPATLASAGAFDLQTPVAARGRDAFLVAWREQAANSYRLLARRVAFDGTPIDAAPIVLQAETNGWFYGAHMPSISIASDGTNWLVVFPNAGFGIGAVRVSPAGTLLDAVPVQVSLPSPHFGIPGSSRVVWSGSRYVALWTEELNNPFLGAPSPDLFGVYEARITAAGQVIDTTLLWTDRAIPDVALAAGPSRLLAAWTNDNDSLYAMVLGNDGTPLTGANVVKSVKAPWPPPLPDVEAAWDGAAFVAAWTVRSTYNDAHIEYEHLDVNGVPVEAAPLELAPELGTKYTPALAPSPGGVTIAFHAIDDTYVARAFAMPIQRVEVPPRRRTTR